MLPRAARLVVVRRGATELFQILCARYADDPETRVIWDRRVTEERRQTDESVPVERRREPRRSNGNATALLKDRGFFVATARRTR
jgi:hypothetical protein